MVLARTFLASFLLVFLTGVEFTSANELAVNGDFSAGNSGFSSDYTYSTYFCCNTSHGDYNVVPVGNINSSVSYGDWVHVTATPSGSTTANVFIADGSTTSNQNFWYETVTVTPNRNYTFSFYGAETSNLGTPASLQEMVNGVALGNSITATYAWQSASYVWNSGANSSANNCLDGYTTEWTV